MEIRSILEFAYALGLSFCDYIVYVLWDWCSASLWNISTSLTWDVDSPRIILFFQSCQTFVLQLYSRSTSWDQFEDRVNVDSWREALQHCRRRWPSLVYCASRAICIYRIPTEDGLVVFNCCTSRDRLQISLIANESNDAIVQVNS